MCGTWRMAHTKLYGYNSSSRVLVTYTKTIHRRGKWKNEHKIWGVCVAFWCFFSHFFSFFLIFSALFVWSLPRSSGHTKITKKRSTAVLTVWPTSHDKSDPQRGDTKEAGHQRSKNQPSECHINGHLCDVSTPNTPNEPFQSIPCQRLFPVMDKKQSTT